MDSPERFFSPVFLEAAFRLEYAEDLGPDTSVRFPNPGENALHDALMQKGFAVAEVYDPEEGSAAIVFMYGDTPYTQSIQNIFHYELSGQLPVGSHKKAMDDLVCDKFEQQGWNKY
jgi:hypothetical protein